MSLRLVAGSKSRIAANRTPTQIEFEWPTLLRFVIFSPDETSSECLHPHLHAADPAMRRAIVDAGNSGRNLRQ
jgi:hypothetical protein